MLENKTPSSLSVYHCLFPTLCKLTYINFLGSKFKFHLVLELREVKCIACLKSTQTCLFLFVLNLFSDFVVQHCHLLFSIFEPKSKNPSSSRIISTFSVIIAHNTVVVFRMTSRIIRAITHDTTHNKQYRAVSRIIQRFPSLSRIIAKS